MELLRQRVALDAEDTKQHLSFTFDLPTGSASLEIVWAFSPWQVGSLKNLITLSLHDPQGFRGAGHRHGQDHHVGLAERWATPGYLPGSLPEGTWTMTLHTHAVLCAVEGELVVQTRREKGPQEKLVEMVSQAPRRAEPAWMMGDLHCHTTHSDARWSPGELAQAAAARGLDFLALTDHNTVSGRPKLASAFPGLLLPGLELTTFHGHAVVLGREEYTDWTTFEPQSGMKALLDELRQAPGYLTLAHPFAPGDPLCTGCGWTYFDLRPENATHMEVWNGPWSGRHNERALAYWYDLLRAGHRVLATAGTDAHGPAYQDELGFTCTPRTSEPAALLEQLKNGETYLSRAPCFDVQVRSDGQTVPLGGVTAPGVWQVSLKWWDLPEGCVMTLTVDGQHLQRSLETAGSLIQEVDVESWLTLEIRLPDGTLFMVTNPVFGFPGDQH